MIRRQKSQNLRSRTKLICSFFFFLIGNKMLANFDFKRWNFVCWGPFLRTNSIRCKIYFATKIFLIVLIHSILGCPRLFVHSQNGCKECTKSTMVFCCSTLNFSFPWSLCLCFSCCWRFLKWEFTIGIANRCFITIRRMMKMRNIQPLQSRF